MEGKDKLVYYDKKGERHEIPIHLRVVKFAVDFQNVPEVEINSLCKTKEECKMWEKLLIDCLSVFADREK